MIRSVISTIILCSSAQLVQAIELATTKQAGAIRVATFNVSLNRSKAGKLAEDLQANDQQAWKIATIIRAINPDILLLNELDFSTETNNAQLFHDLYLARPDADLLGSGPVELPYRFSAPVNTGLPSGLDLNNNGRVGDPEDAWGFGNFPGQFGMAVLSRYEIDENCTRTFQKLLWSELPGALQPVWPETGDKYYTEETWRRLRLSSKSLWDVVIRTPAGEVHLLASHPTPPVFDGPEDHNGCRNHDEIRLLSLYITDQPKSSAVSAGKPFWIDDQGRPGALPPDALFVVVGDLNSDPIDGDSRHSAIGELLDCPRIAAQPIPQSAGAVAAAKEQGKKNLEQQSNPAYDTGDFNDRSVGNLRIDYVLPSTGLRIVDSGVVWPVLSGLDADVAGKWKSLLEASDHHMVWVDLMPATRQNEPN
ncbi:MAG: endonuclease/exonuclease/phosphatase family protein [Pirellulaceae bacterium]|nr:endonuclease/exonuclease/phosphatase family protein [Pirellulaceae bacterium]